MALLSSICCIKCKQTKEVLHASYQIAPDICDDCSQKQKEDDKVFHLYKLKKLTVEQRLAAIEEQLYDWMEYEGKNSKRFEERIG